MRLRIFLSLAFTVLVAGIVRGQEPTSPARGGATVSGVVRDSLSDAPLADAMVQLVAANDPTRFGRVTTSDSLGRFSFGGVPDGAYNLGFFHPRLDSLGVEAPIQAVYVVEQHPVHADLGGPSAEQLRTAYCGRTAADAGSVVVGVVRDSRDRTPVAGATVLGEWIEITYAARVATPKIPGMTAKSGDQGWFILCGLPKAGIIGLTASRGADSTGLVELDVPPERILRRDFYLGPARVADRTGNGRLSGTVVTIVGGKPLPGAEVGIADGPMALTNERGEWSMTAVPTGTRMLEIRAVGYYPVRQPVDVVADAPPVHVAMFTLKAMLDTVKVAATRSSHRMITGFDDRHRSGAGTYLTPADVAKHKPIVASDLFRFVPGIKIENVGRFGDRRFFMRGAFSERCNPEVYVNDHYMSHIGADDVDSWVRPNEIEGIEIYSEASVPPQFHRSMSDCGAIVIWTKGW
jgi:hypothetical protein